VILETVLVKVAKVGDWRCCRMWLVKGEQVITMHEMKPDLGSRNLKRVLFGGKSY
jgi:hypothetical protein